MRIVTYSMGISLDGYIVGPDGGFDWPVPDEENFRFVTAIEEFEVSPDRGLFRSEPWIDTWVDDAFDALLTDGHALVSTPLGTVETWFDHTVPGRSGLLRNRSRSTLGYGAKGCTTPLSGSRRSAVGSSGGGRPCAWRTARGWQRRRKKTALSFWERRQAVSSFVGITLPCPIDEPTSLRQVLTSDYLRLDRNDHVMAECIPTPGRARLPPRRRAPRRGGCRATIRPDRTGRPRPGRR